VRISSCLGFQVIKAMISLGIIQLALERCKNLIRIKSDNALAINLNNFCDFLSIDLLAQYHLGHGHV